MKPLILSTSACLAMAMLLTIPTTGFTQGTTVIRPNLDAPSWAWSARPDVLQPSSITADYYITEQGENWGYERDFDYDRLSYDEHGSVYSLYDTYYNNYTVKAPAPGVIDPRRDVNVITPEEMPQPPVAVGPKSPLVDPAEAIIPRTAAYPPPLEYGYDETNDDDNWVYDYYESPEALRNPPTLPPSYYERFDFVNDPEGDGPFDGVTNQNALKTPPERSQDNQSSNPRSTETTKVTQSLNDKSVRGTVTMIKNVPITGQDVKNRVVRIENQQGKQFIVDLGPLTTLDDQNIQTGMNLLVRGVLANVGEKEMILAREFRIGENRIVVDRSLGIVQGTIKDVQLLDNQGDPIQIITVETQNGETVVDLGLATISEKIVLRTGNPITVTGNLIQVKDRNVLMAQTVLQRETTVEITRPETDRMAQTSQQKPTKNKEQNSESDSQSDQPPLAIASTINENGRKKTIVMNKNGQTKKTESDPAETDPAETDSASENEKATPSVESKLAKQDSPSQKEAMVSLQGTIENSSDQKYGESTRKILTVKTEAGNQVRLDLGPSSSVSITLDPGMNVTAYGVVTQLKSETPLILVHRLNQGDKSFKANRYQADMKTTNISGEVVSSNTNTVLGKTHGILTLNTDDDQKVMVDVGPVKADQFQVVNGTKLKVEGVSVDIRQGQMIVANKIDLMK